MKIILFYALFLLGSAGLTAQHSTMNFSDSPFTLNHQSLLLVPFESKMFLSDITKELMEHNQMKYEEIVEQFTNGIDQSIYHTFRKKCDVSSFYALNNEAAKSNLSYIYQNLKLEYELISKTKKQSKLKQLKQKFQSNRDDDYHRGELREGQIITKKDERERYMKAVVEDQKMLDSMHFVFNNTYFLFVNQLDIKNQYKGAIAMQNMNYQRAITLHYTLYRKSGEILTTGISKTTFPATQNDINVIIKNYFPILAQNIYQDLFETEADSKEKTSNFRIWK